MPEHAPTDIQEASPALSKVRLALLGVLVLAILAALFLMFGTSWGALLRHHPHEVGRQVQTWVDRHAVLSPLILIGAYVLATILLLPVWPLQVLAGYGFGMYAGSAWCIGAATVSAVITWAISRWLGGEWFQGRVEARLAKLARVDEAMRHNGFLVVLCVRAIHVLPFALSNYIFGLSRINAVEVGAGTLLGNLPAIVFYVALGVDLELVKRPIFWAVLAGIQIAVLIPVAARYWRPRLFQRIGLE